MALIQLRTFIAAPAERCFDLSLSVDLHLASAASTDERAIEGAVSGVMRLGDTVTWEASHLGLRRRLSVRITQYERPRRFRDEMISGPFRWMRHDHHFETAGGGTIMSDIFEFSTIPLLDFIVVVPHVRRFLVARNETIRLVAEGEDWRRYLSDADYEAV